MASSQQILLSFAGQSFAQMQQAYLDHGDEAGVPDFAQYLVKRVLEDLRSALDWMATELWTAVGGSGKRSPYYPLSEDRNVFVRTVDRDFPGLRKTRSDVVDAMEARQPFAVPNGALSYLRGLSNMSKHQGFVAQRRAEGRHSQMIVAGMGFMSMGPDGATLGVAPAAEVAAGDAMQAFDENGNGMIVTPTYSWRFSEPDLPVLGTLKKLHAEVSQTIGEVSAALTGDEEIHRI